MAFQRPFLIILKREEPGQPWGFRVSGGADLATPPRVDKVVDGGLAALQGMHEGDLIIQVGKHNVQDLSEARINALLAQPAKRLEVFIVREDFLQKPRKGEPSTVKAVVHNQYNSPLQLYSQEKVAETLAYHAQAITAEDGVNDIQPVGLPKTLVRSAVLQALGEDGTGANPYRTANGTTVVQRAAAPPTPPPKPRPPSYSGGSPQPERPYSSSAHHVTFSNPGTPGTPPVQQHHTYVPPPPPLHSYQQPSYQQPSYQQPSYQQPSYQPQPASYPVQHTRQSSYEEADRRQQQIREAELRQRQYEEERLQQAQYEEGRFRQPPQDFRRVEYDAEQRRLREEEERQRRVLREEEKRRQQEEQERKRRQEQQEYEQYQQHQQQYQRYLEEQKRKDDELRRRNTGQQQQQYQQQQYQQQQEAARRRQLEEQQQRSQQQQQRYQNAQREPLNVQRAQQEAQRRYQPSTAVASSPQHQEQVGSQAQRWESRIWEEQQARMPGTPLGSPSVTRRARDNVWPPKESSVRWTPKTGFSPQLTRQSSQGAKQFVWPPPKTGVANGDEGFPSRPPSRTAVNAWHPASPTSGMRTPPFARSPSLGRRTRDIAWPPPQAEASPKFVPRPVSRTGLHRPDEFIHQNASCGVPPTYRPPPNSSQYL